MKRWKIVIFLPFLVLTACGELNGIDENGTPSPIDFNRDEKVNYRDFFLFAGHFGTQPGDGAWDPIYDTDDSGRVDFVDFFTFVDHMDRLDLDLDVNISGDFSPEPTTE